MHLVFVLAGAGRSLEAAGPADLVPAGIPAPSPWIAVYAGERVEPNWHASTALNLRSVTLTLAAVGGGGTVVAADLPVEAESERLDAAGARPSSSWRRARPACASPPIATNPAGWSRPRCRVCIGSVWTRRLTSSF